MAYTYEIRGVQEWDKQEYFKQLVSSPFPQQSGQFEAVHSFADRIKLMEPIVDGKVYKTLLRAGREDCPVILEGAILFHLNAFLEEASEPFDSSFARKTPLLSRLNQMLHGYAYALNSMKMGELAEFAIHYSVAYGELGCPPRIPAKANIIVIIEVLEVYEKNTIQYYHSQLFYSKEEDDTLTMEQRFKFALEDRLNGNEHYREGNYRKALFHYRRAIDVLERNFGDDQNEREINQSLLTLYHNACNVQIFLDHGPAVVNFARRALRIDPQSVKANYQLGVGYIKLGKFEKAKDYLSRASRSRPNDPDINRELNTVNQILAEQGSKEKELYRKMSKAIG